MLLAKMSNLRLNPLQTPYTHTHTHTHTLRPRANQSCASTLGIRIELRGLGFRKFLGSSKPPKPSDTKVRRLPPARSQRGRSTLELQLASEACLLISGSEILGSGL